MSIRFMDDKQPPEIPLFAPAQYIKPAQGMAFELVTLSTEKEYEIIYQYMIEKFKNSKGDWVYAVNELPDGTYEHKLTLKDGAK